MENINLRSIRWESIKSVFLSIAKSEKTSRADISADTDLSLMTVGKVADALMNIEAIEQYKGVSIVYSAGDLFGKSNSTSFLFQQTFTLDANQNLVAGEMFLLPIAKGENGIPAPVLDAEGAQSFQSEMVTASSTVRYGVEKKNGFPKENLNLIMIQK
jgi:hypothetical protein